jgi:hypothetical protein
VITVTTCHRRDGSIAIKIGRKTTVLRTGAEAQAFMAGVKIAHLALAAQIGPLLSVKDAAHD